VTVLPEGVVSPLDRFLGLRVEEASGERVVASLEVTADLHQVAGIVHGGVYAAVAETTASIGAGVWLAGTGLPVGMANHTDFLRPVRAGTLRAEATPVERDDRTQLWRVDVTDGGGRLVATGRVRLMTLRQGAIAEVGSRYASQPPAADPPAG
jgi:1,4-dihydroxy-2-naphthoyl-CoA hydrolase